MSRYHRHVGGAAILLACAVLAYVVFRPAPLEKPRLPTGNPQQQNRDAGNIEPKANTPVATGDEKQGPAAGTDELPDSGSPDKTGASEAAIPAQEAPQRPRS